MTRITGRKALLYLPERETCLGLKIPGDRLEIEASSTIDISYAFSAKERLEELLASLPDASGEFTGYFDKGDCDGKDSPSPSGT